MKMPKATEAHSDVLELDTLDNIVGGSLLPNNAFTFVPTETGDLEVAMTLDPPSINLGGNEIAVNIARG